MKQQMFDMRALARIGAKVVLDAIFEEFPEMMHSVETHAPVRVERKKLGRPSKRVGRPPKRKLSWQQTPKGRARLSQIMKSRWRKRSATNGSGDVAELPSGA